jgi:hypothetical protein
VVFSMYVCVCVFTRVVCVCVCVRACEPRVNLLNTYTHIYINVYIDTCTRMHEPWRSG